MTDPVRPDSGKTPVPPTVHPPETRYARQTDFTGDGWRVFKIMAEFVNGFEKMSDTGPAVSVFGSTRVGPDSIEYAASEEMGRLLAANGFSVITGGGPGVMEAANKGAQQAGGVSIGFNIELPNQQRPNPYIDQDRLVTFQYFFVRKVMFLKYSQAFVVLPGGFGTMDELSEAITLIQTQKSRRFPVILMGSDYWGGFYRWVRSTMLGERNYISGEDLDFIFMEDDPETVIGIIREFCPEGFKLNF
ncbi:Rossman fold protein, TIGR00730 family [Prosthecochloris sp. GSB1]|uniref:LOG family protein n=1 Tax=Prosthecochloris sp. GSB1 TaxID=281093 RepID=UPI000B8CDF9C|nr:TIGR00730 family Rossman fold protein [Prosthecochloris sp. GSB1]ASQ91173.1 Rossman fold protein, TIGR00730 family [Prosthecochloris sp. GSB1]